MNLQWAYAHETALPRTALHADADGVMHLDTTLLAEIFHTDCAHDDDEDFDIYSSPRTELHFRNN
jgi:hypothetical protein